MFSFHETKNLVSGQGGCISINNPNLKKGQILFWIKVLIDTILLEITKKANLKQD